MHGDDTGLANCLTREEPANLDAILSKTILRRKTANLSLRDMNAALGFERIKRFCLKAAATIR